MGILRKVLNKINYILKPLNMELTTSTKNISELSEIETHYEEILNKPVFPLIKGISDGCFENQFDQIAKTFNEFKKSIEFLFPTFNFNNGFFETPDGEMLYHYVKKYRPSKIIEIGCGNSTYIIQAAIKKENFICEHTCIDPYPRMDIGLLNVKFIKSKLQKIKDISLFTELKPNDIFFIDSSHISSTGSDVNREFLEIIPKLNLGVIIHVHDIFLPFEYPLRWQLEQRKAWNEQYILQALLYNSENFEIIFPGYFLSKTNRKYKQLFDNRYCQSFWFTKRA